MGNRLIYDIVTVGDILWGRRKQKYDDLSIGVRIHKRKARNKVGGEANICSCFFVVDTFTEYTYSSRVCSRKRCLWGAAQAKIRRFIDSGEDSKKEGTE